MTPEELPLIRNAMRGVLPPIVDVGSSTLAFRRRDKCPYDLVELIGQRIVSFDLQAAPGVDVVGDAERLTDYLPARSANGVICTSLLEHTRRPWIIVQRIGELLRHGGHAVITVPWVYPEHRDPIDCWRISPEGLSALATDAGLQRIAAGILECGDARISYFVGLKR